MLRNRKETQQRIGLVIPEQVVPETHLLRKIDRSIGFSFINKLCASLYSENVGRLAVEPASCSACYSWDTCEESVPNGVWVKISTTTSQTNGSAV